MVLGGDSLSSLRNRGAGIITNPSHSTLLDPRAAGPVVPDKKKNAALTTGLVLLAQFLTICISVFPYSAPEYGVPMSVWALCRCE